MQGQRKRGLMSVADVAQLLNVSRGYVTRLMREGRLGEVVVVEGKKHLLRAKAEAYHRELQRIGHTALREMACITQEAGAHDLKGKTMTIEETFLTIAVYDGKYTGGPAAPTRICRIEGSVIPYDRPRYSLLEEALKVLELCADKYSTPRAAGKHITVFVDSERSTGSKPLMRLDIRVVEGHAVANIAGNAPSYKHTATVDVDNDDDVATIVRKVLTQL